MNTKTNPILNPSLLSRSDYGTADQAFETWLHYQDSRVPVIPPSDPEDDHTYHVELHVVTFPDGNETARLIARDEVVVDPEHSFVALVEGVLDRAEQQLVGPITEDDSYEFPYLRFVITDLCRIPSVEDAD